MVTFNYTEEFLRQAKRLSKRYRSLADDIDTCVNLLTIYDKKEIQNVSEDYIDQIIQNL